MNKCLKISVTVDNMESFMRSVVQRLARECGLEGMVQPLDDTQIRIVVCGKKTNVDTFVELLQKEHTSPITIEPFAKEKDFRGVFRVIA